MKIADHFRTAVPWEVPWEVLWEVPREVPWRSLLA